MSDEPQVLRTIDWRTVFPFTQLFRAFRIAIHPAKLVLALLAIVIIYSCGRVLDTVWPNNYAAIPNEIALYERPLSKKEYASELTETRGQIFAQRRAALRELRAEAAPAGTTAATVDATYRPSIDELKDLLAESRDRQVKVIHDTYASSTKTDEDAKTRDAGITRIYARAAEMSGDLRQLEIRGLGLTFLEYEADRVDDIARGIIMWNWFTSTEAGPAVLPSLYRFVFTGPGWALSKHPVYFIPMTLLTLLVWSVIGGAIARLAAVHVAQDEKISVRHALRFSSNKLMSFFAAPIMPLLLVGAVALVLALVGWISELSYLGGFVSVLVGAIFIVLIGVGVLVACAVVGTVCGFGLMYPTIAVEGSDAFDAVSRSFSYVFARPWKIVVYSVIALVYAAITYVFLRFMCWLTLSLLHNFLTLWTHHSVPDGHTSLATSWPAPLGLFQLVPPYDGFNLTFAGGLTYGLLIFWAYLFVALLGAYLLSYFVSVNTIMYYLLRYDVDATELDDVYLEPTDDEEFETVATTSGQDPGTPLSTGPASSAPSSAAPATAAVIAAAGGANLAPGAMSNAAPIASPPPAATSPAIVEPAITPPPPPTVIPGGEPPTPPPDKPQGDPVKPD